MADNIKSFGETVRDLRENKGLLLRQVAAVLEVDTAFLSKMERNEKKASRQQVLKLAKALETAEKELLTLWLSDKIVEILNEESEAYGALKLTEKRIKRTM
ncbi:MAG: helix-turn-helix transcriptional regulator [Chitinophagaceae bacterium]|nr:helix-turn-helix transcriptional regulator [Chitinophagaceae bacterium]